MLTTLSLQNTRHWLGGQNPYLAFPNSHFLGPHSFLVQSARAMKMKNHVEKWEHSKDLFFWGGGKGSN